jgi:hypothetical protein
MLLRRSGMPHFFEHDMFERDVKGWANGGFAKDRPFPNQSQRRRTRVSAPHRAGCPIFRFFCERWDSTDAFAGVPHHCALFAQGWDSAGASTWAFSTTSLTMRDAPPLSRSNGAHATPEAYSTGSPRPPIH